MYDESLEIDRLSFLNGSLKRYRPFSSARGGAAETVVGPRHGHAMRRCVPTN